MVKILREQLIRKLSQGRFISGQLLADELAVSRAAISKHIKVLNDMGLDIFSVKGKGYRLANPITLLDEQQLSHKLLQLKCDNRVDVHTIIDSTNSYLMRRLPNNVLNGQACIAEYQSAGRGRRGKQWQSPFGSHLYLSLYWQLNQGLSAAMGLSLAVGIAVSEVLANDYAMDVQLKWPNDIYYQGRKLAGILIELDAQSEDSAHSVIGLGLNVHMPKHSAEEIDQPWADLTQALGEGVDRNILAAKLIAGIMNKLELHQQFGLAPMVTDWRKRDFFYNKPVRLITGSKEVRGTCQGINNKGALLMDVDGITQPFYGGEISLRGA